MAITATNATSEKRAFSIGPVKMQILTYTATTGAGASTITADQLFTVTQVFADGGLVFTSPTTYSGNTATLTVASTGATVYGTFLVLGY